MQLLESSDLGLRTARIYLRSAEHQVTFTLFPMVHLGEQAFFDTVAKDASRHDIAFVEGVGRSRVTRQLTSSYRWAAAAPRLGLAVQQTQRMLAGSSIDVVNADLSQNEFHKEWRKVSPAWRLAAYAVSPLIGLQRRFASTRRDIAEGMSLDDLTSRREHLSWDAAIETLNRAILHSRDERLVATIGDYLDEHPKATARATVIFGARHIRAVLRYLTGVRAYQIQDTRWLTVFGL